jgi:hypothetical protein
MLTATNKEEASMLTIPETAPAMAKKCRTGRGQIRGATGNKKVEWATLLIAGSFLCKKGSHTRWLTCGGSGEEGEDTRRHT